MHRSIHTICIVLFVPLLFWATAQAGVYKFKQDGVWHFTDDPAALPADQRPATVDAPALPDAAPTDLTARLIAALSPSNAIETAALATVLIETGSGYGSGFFVTADGYILTNKHVVRPQRVSGATQAADTSAQAAVLARRTAQIDIQAQRLQASRDELDAFKRYIDDQPESVTRQYNESRYRESLARYQAGQRALDEARRKLSAQRSSLEAALLQKRIDDGMAALNQNFTIRLADNTPLYAYVVEISDDNDLAVLKVDGYATPFLKARNPLTCAQGDPVYAIGNPVTLRNSVASGVVSGFKGPFVKTNAQIYPGNSGGPLVTSQGNVIGINTFKTLTRKFEGLGFAISIQVALDDLESI
ncbi:hypothetical protein JCM12296A_09830 [Desulfosarcina cetonica]